MSLDPSVAEVVPVGEVPAPVLRTCGHCERTDVGSVAAGDAEVDGVPLCDPKRRNSERPHCRVLVVKYRHFLPCRVCVPASKSRF